MLNFWGGVEELKGEKGVFGGGLTDDRMMKSVGEFIFFFLFLFTT